MQEPLAKDAAVVEKPVLPGTVEGEKAPKLLDQLRRAVRVRNYSIRTEHSYADWVYRYLAFHNKRHPAERARIGLWRSATLLSRIGYAALWALAFLSTGDKQP